MSAPSDTATAGASAVGKSDATTDVTDVTGPDAVSVVLARVSAAIEALVTAVRRYAEKSETAQKFMDAALKQATAAFKEVSRRATEIRAIPITEMPVVAVLDAVELARAALKFVVDTAVTYDKEYGVSERLTDIVAASRSAAEGAVAAALTRVQRLRNGEDADGTDKPEAGEGAAAGMRAAGSAAISAALGDSRAAVEDVLKRLLEHDKVAAVKTTATSVFASTTEVVQAAVEELQKVAATLRETPAREVPAKAINTALDHARTALAALNEQVAEYDSKYKMSESVKAAIEKANATVAETTALVQGRATSAAGSAADAAIRGAISLDGRLGVSGAAASIAGKAVEGARAVDEKYGVVAAATPIVEAAASLDEKYTGGYAAAAVKLAQGIVESTVDAVSTRVDEVRKADADADTGAPKAEGAVEGAAAADAVEADS